MIRFILLFIFFWLAVRFVSRLVRGALFFSRTDPSGERRKAFARRRSGRVEEAEYEVLDSRMRDDRDRDG